MTGTRAIFPIHRSGLYSSSKNRLAGQAIGHVTIREDSLSRTIRRYPAKGLSRSRGRGRWGGGGRARRDPVRGEDVRYRRAGVPVTPGDVRRIPARPSVPAVIEGEDRVPLPDEPKDRLDMSADVLRVAVEEEDRPAGGPVERGQEPPLGGQPGPPCDPDV